MTRMGSTFPFSNSPYANRILVALIAAALVGLYYPVIALMAQDWSKNDNYSHGFFIPLISGYMVYMLREELKRIDLQPVNWGGLVLLLGLAQLYIAKVGSEYFLQRSSLLLVLLGIALFVAGTSVTRKLLVPIVYLFFMIPWPAIVWNKVAFPMQLFSSAVTEIVIQFIGIPVFREGNVLHLAQTTLEVVDACSGLRSLTTMFALSAAFAWFSDLSTRNKWLLFFAAAPIAVFANILRLTGTAGLASVYGGKVAQGFLHDFSGLFVFVIGLLLLVLSNKLLRYKFKRVD